ncbi:MAG: TolC family protein [Bacteroidales bacterium]|jgi:outer membrane protein|nr:TolC family protein [Bacteroidales bacterium]
MRKTIFLIITLCFPAIFQHLAAQPYTLEDCRQMAIEKNAQLQEMKIGEQISLLMKKQAMTYFFPNISAFGMGFKASNPVISLDLGMLGSMSLLKDGVMVSAMAVQPVFMGGKIFYSTKLADTGVRASELFTAQKKDEVLAKTDEYYWLLYSLYEKRKTVALMQQVLDSLYKDVHQAVNAGVLGQNEVLKVKLQQHTLSTKNVELENGIYLATMALARQMGFPVDSVDHFVIAPAQDILVDDPIQYFLEPAAVLSLRTEYKLLEMGVRAASLEKKIETASYMPQVGVGAFYYYENLLDKNNWNGAVMAAVRIPISDWGRGSYAIRQKKLEESKAQIRREDGHQQLLMQIRQAWGSFVEAYQKYLLAELTVEESQENARLNETYYRAGTVSLTELLAARGFLQESQDKRIDAIRDYQVAKSIYLQVTGR